MDRLLAALVRIFAFAARFTDKSPTATSPADSGHTPLKTPMML